jgi:hypothetical protein
MTKEDTLWLLVVQEGRCRLQRTRKTGRNRTWWLPMELVAELSNPYAELGPAALLSSPLDRSDLFLMDRRAEFLQRYVRDLHRWIQDFLREHRIEQLHVFAPEPMLVTLHRSNPVGLPPQVVTHPLDPLTLPRSELERQRALLEILDPAASPKPDALRVARPKRPAVQRSGRLAREFRAPAQKRRR